MGLRKQWMRRHVVFKLQNGGLTLGGPDECFAFLDYVEEVMPLVGVFRDESVDGARRPMIF